jgi:hypothetical protein
VVEPFRRALVEGAVAAAKGAVVPGEPGELLSDPQLRPRSEEGEDGKVRPEGAADELAECVLELLALRPLVVHGQSVLDKGGN